MNSNNHSVINTLLAIELVLLITVMFGGESLLRMLDGQLSAHTERFFRAGHAHAGVFNIVGMVLVLVLPRTDLSNQAIVFTWLAWVLGVVLLAGGFFLHAFQGEPGQVSLGTTVTAIGGIVLGFVAVWIAWNLWRAR